MIRSTIARVASVARTTVHRLRRADGPKAAVKAWARQGFSMPAPTPVKWNVLMRYGNATDTWIETGTYLGDTTAKLAAAARHVYSIEPQPDLARAAQVRFGGTRNVTIVRGLSEDHFGALLDQVDGPLSVWLDGHYSAGNTFQGPIDTPIRQEMAALEERQERFAALTVLVDDVRCFDPGNDDNGAYPSRSWLVAWANRCGMAWTIEHDIFVAWKGRTQSHAAR